jgi:hypothetical protein
MSYGFDIRKEGALDFVSIGGLVCRLDPGISLFVRRRNVSYT